ncbi:geranylgeranyl reductase family protein [Jatrophihabitans sp. DSM 45814]
MAAPPTGNYEQWDVIVVGAGPAGCASAAAVLKFGPGLRVLVLDRADFPRDKACGDGIAHEVRQTLADLDFDTAAVFADAPPIDRLALRSPAGIEVNRQMRQQVHVIRREIFDARLVADVRARGVTVRRHEVRSLRSEPGAIVIDGSLRATVVIGADGAESVVRRAVGVAAAPRERVAFAIRGYAPELANQHGAQVIVMTTQRWPAYAWSFPLGDGHANVGYGELLGSRPLNRTGMLSRMAELLPGLDPKPSRLRAHRLPLSSGRPRIAAGPVLLVGDAQSLINPFTGEGIFYAVTSGALAGQAATAGVLDDQVDAGVAYRALSRDRLGRHFLHTSALARLGRWPGLVDAGMRAARDDQQVFDELVRFGLADGLLTPRIIRRLRFADAKR